MKKSNSAFSNKSNGVITSIELKSVKYRILYWIIFLILMALVIISLFPSIWVLLSGFKDVKEMYAIPPDILPKTIRLSKLKEVWDLIHFGRSYIATIIISLGDLFFCIIFPALGGFVLSRLKPKGSKLVMTILMWTMMMPGQIRTVPLFMTFNDVPLLHTSLMNSYLPIWIMAGANIFYILLFKDFFDSIPIAYLEAARIDGSSNIVIFSKIILPLSKPILIVVMVLSINSSWSSFLWPLLILKDERLEPITVKLFNMKGNYMIDQYMLGLVFAMLPPTIIYAFFQKQILGGTNIGGVKG